MPSRYLKKAEEVIQGLDEAKERRIKRLLYSIAFKFPHGYVVSSCNLDMQAVQEDWDIFLRFWERNKEDVYCDLNEKTQIQGLLVSVNSDFFNRVTMFSHLCPLLRRILRVLLKNYELIAGFLLHVDAYFLSLFGKPIDVVLI